jgi:hypothetical protein
MEKSTETSASTSNDILGIRPFGEATNTIVTKSIEAAENLLTLTCKPALAELGLMIHDKVRAWRLNNVARTLEKAKDKYEFVDNQIQLKANPKVIINLVDGASIEENDELQDMWAGLFASSCTRNPNDDENLIYITILKQLTLSEVKLIKYMCEKTKKFYRNNNLIVSQTVSPYIDELQEITGITSTSGIEAILNHLTALKLNDRGHGGSTPAGFVNSTDKLLVWLTPTSLAMNFYLRCVGHRGEIDEYWEVERPAPTQEKKNK